MKRKKKDRNEVWEVGFYNPISYTLDHYYNFTKALNYLDFSNFSPLPNLVPKLEIILQKLPSLSLVIAILSLGLIWWATRASRAADALDSWVCLLLSLVGLELVSNKGPV